MIMHKTLHLRDDTDWLYVSRKEWIELASTDDCLYATIQGFEKNTKKSK